MTLKGTASDTSCGKKGTVRTLVLSIARRQTKTKGRYLLTSGRLGPLVPYAKPVFLPIKGRARFSYSHKVRLPKGHYLVTVTAVDAAGNRGARLNYSKFPKTLKALG